MAQQHKVGSVATSVRRQDGVLSVVYHATEVVKVSGRTVTLRNGGYYTNTTKTRMNQAANQYGLGFRVSQENHAWAVTVGGKVTPFTDGMVFEMAASLDRS